MKPSGKVLLLPLVSLLALAVFVASVAAATDRQIALRASSSYPAAKGTAQYQAQPGQREIQMEVEHIRSLAGQRVYVFVGQSRLGAARVNARGMAELNRNTERRQRVPQVHSGTTVTVWAINGAKVVAGTF